MFFQKSHISKEAAIDRVPLSVIWTKNYSYQPVLHRKKEMDQIAVTFTSSALDQVY